MAGISPEEARALAAQAFRDQAHAQATTEGLAYARAYLHHLEGTHDADIHHLERCPPGDCWYCGRHTHDRIIYGVTLLCPRCTGHRTRVHQRLIEDA